tara:strand:+ start:121 stop:240 length:120 start_codon:yes stop_codon:yes gene_type:complete
MTIIVLISKKEDVMIEKPILKILSYLYIYNNISCNNEKM